MKKRNYILKSVIISGSILVILLFTFIITPILHVQATTQTTINSINESRIILTFQSQKEKNDFLNNLKIITKQTPNNINAKSLQTTNDTVNQNNLVEENFGDLPIITLDITPQEKATLQTQFPNAQIAQVERKHLFLNDSVPLINATSVWQIQQVLQPSQTLQNLTGVGQSACIIDTGIQANHPDFAGKYIVQKCFCSSQPSARTADCCPNGQNTDTNATDIYGHGTHVAGIVAANGIVKGVAPDANIVAVKVFGTDNDASISAYNDDLIKAIQYCTSNSSIYNITVISMSLGDGLYSNSCPSDQLASSISAALAKNISVVVATGNDFSSTQISSPACVPGVTKVAATYKNDSLTSFSNTNYLVSLVAPGYDIVSTYINSSYAQLSGTSMATPHVSGSILLLRQALANVNLSKNTTLIESALNTTANKIYSQSRSRNFSRINIYSALLTFSNFATSNIDYNSVTQTNATNLSRSWFLINVSENNFILSYINISIYNSTQQLIWTQNSTTTPLSINFSTPYDGIFFFNATSTDIFASKNYTQTRTIAIDTTAPTINYISPTPADNLSTTNNTFAINISANDTNLRFINLSIYNLSNNLIWRENSTASQLEFNFTAISDGVYYYNATATDWVGWTNSTQTRNISINAHAPILLNYSFGYISNDSALIYTTIDSIANATIQFGTNDSLNDINANETLTTNHSFTLTQLTNDTTYYFNITYIDAQLNNATVGTYNFTTLHTFITINESQWLANETTNFSTYTVAQLLNIFDVNFSNYNGKISFLENISITQPRNLTNYILITQNKIEVNTTALPEFNHSADLTFRNITLTHPIVKRNSLDCSSSNGNCSNQVYNTSTKTYSVKVGAFSTYQLVEQCSDGVKNYDEKKVDCGGSNCAACPPSGSAGGSSSSSSRSSGGAAISTPLKKLNTTNTGAINITLNNENTNKENSSLTQVAKTNTSAIIGNYSNSTQKQTIVQSSKQSFQLNNKLIVTVTIILLLIISIAIAIIRK